MAPALPPEDDDLSAQAAGRRRLLKGLRPYTLGDEALRRVEAGVLAGIKERQRRWWFVLAGGAVLAAAAALAVVLLGRTFSPAPGLPGQGPLVAARAAGAFPPLTAVLVQGPVQVKTDPGGGWKNVALGDRLGAGAWIASGEGAQPGVEAGGKAAPPTGAVAARLGLVSTGGAKLALDVRGSVHFLEGPEVALLQGSVAADVALAEPLMVDAGERFVRAKDALFEVLREGARVRVVVSRGSVEVADNRGFQGARRLTAPASLELNSGSSLGAAKVEGLGATGLAVYAPSAPWGTVELNVAEGHPQVHAVRFDTFELPLLPVRLLASQGKHGVSWQLPNGTLQTAEVVAGLTPAALVLEPRQLPLPALQRELTVEQLRAGVQSVSKRLESCADKWLSLDGPAGGGEVLAALHISPSGHISQVAVRGDGREVPATVRDCVEAVLHKLTFPKADVGTDVELPIRVVSGVRP